MAQKVRMLAHPLFTPCTPERPNRLPYSYDMVDRTPHTNLYWKYCCISYVQGQYSYYTEEYEKTACFAICLMSAPNALIASHLPALIIPFRVFHGYLAHQAALASNDH